MSAAALSLLAGYVALVGIHEPRQDEGAAARIFQFLLSGQVPIVAVFAVQWLPKKPAIALRIIALQVIAAVIPFIIVFLLELSLRS